MTTTPPPITTDLTKPMRAVCVVAYIHAEVGDERIKEAQDIMIDALVEVGPDWVDDGVQMIASTIIPIDANEAIEWSVDDLDDLDDDEVWDLDDLRDSRKHGSTPR